MSHAPSCVRVKTLYLDAVSLPARSPEFRIGVHFIRSVYRDPIVLRNRDTAMSLNIERARDVFPIISFRNRDINAGLYLGGPLPPNFFANFSELII